MKRVAGVSVVWLVVTVTLMVHLTTVGGLEADSCSLVQYGTAMGACWVPYGMELLGGVMNGSSRIEDVFINSCGTPLNNSLVCHANVDSTCGFRLLDTTRARAALDYLCQNYRDIANGFNIGRCHDSTALSSRGCLPQHSYLGNVCGMTGSLRLCVNTILQPCGKYISTLFDAIFKVVMMESCAGVSPKINAPGQCTAVESLGTIGMCVAGGLTKLITGQQSITDMCNEKPNNALDTAINCIDAVQTECGISYINVAELRALKNSACASVDNFESGCMSHITANNTAPCFNAVAISSAPSGVDLCKLTGDFRACTEAVFARCPSALQTFLNDALDAATLPCPDTTPSTKCSVVEHISTVAMCWYTSAQTMVPWEEVYAGERIRYDFGVHFSELCGKNRGLVDKSIACHVAADKRCGWTTVRPELLTQLFDEFCSNVMVFFTDTRFRCVDDGKSREFVTCAVRAKNIDASADRAYCPILRHIQGCMNAMLSGCSTLLRNKATALSDIIIDNVCSNRTVPTLPPHPCDRPDKGGCEHRCVKEGDGYRCECDPGYQLDGDMKSCTRIPPVAPAKPRCPQGWVAKKGRCFLGLSCRYVSCTANQARDRCRSMDGELAQSENRYFSSPNVGGYVCVLARNGCHSMDAELAQVLAEEDGSFFLSHVFAFTAKYMIVDGRDELVEGEWVYANGTALTFSNWWFPRHNTNTRNCVYLKSNGFRVYLTVLRCDRRMAGAKTGFVCEIAPK